MKLYLILIFLVITFLVLLLFDKKIIEVKKRLKILAPNTNFVVVKSLTNSTFTVGKHTIYLCTKTQDINTIMYVAIHELAHIQTQEYGHGIEFKKVFKDLLDLAVEKGLWNAVDYSKNPQKYCNLTVTDNFYTN